MPAASWKDLDAVRQALPRRLSRAEWARRAGISESTITKGLRDNSRPRKDLRQQAELVLEAERVAAAAGGIAVMNPRTILNIAIGLAVAGEVGFVLMLLRVLTAPSGTGP